MTKTLQVLVSGRVQGVAYRYWTQIEAQHRKLTGFVRNRRDGSVEAVFCGEQSVVDAMVQSCWQGPTLSNVVEVSAKPFECAPMSSFEILATL